MTKEEMIDLVIADDMRSIRDNGEWYLSSLLLHGFKGYGAFSEQELKQELNERSLGA